MIIHMIHINLQRQCRWQWDERVDTRGHHCLHWRCPLCVCLLQGDLAVWGRDIALLQLSPLEGAMLPVNTSTIKAKCQNLWQWKKKNLWEQSLIIMQPTAWVDKAVGLYLDWSKMLEESVRVLYCSLQVKFRCLVNPDFMILVCGKQSCTIS